MSTRSEDVDPLAALFSPAMVQVAATTGGRPWQVLLVDDDEDIHAVIRLALQDVVIEGRPLSLLDALSTKEARATLAGHSDMALIVLDEVIESQQASLDLVRHVRDGLGNRSVQIVLSSGQPRYTAQREVLSAYAIDGYWLKSELSADRIFVAISAAIRTHRLLRDQETLQQDLQQKVKEVNDTLRALRASEAKIRQDITERKLAEAELRRSNAELEQFSSAISHDLRQPLRLVSSYLQLLGISLADTLDGERREYFNCAVEGAKRLDRMLVGLLDYSRVGRLGEPPAWVESRAIVDEALLVLQPAILEAQAMVDVHGFWPRVWVRPDEMLRLVQNLLGNAAKFRLADRKPEISVASWVAGGAWRLSVADNGVGIAQRQIGRLFQMFQRLQSRARYEGSGIGLALCRKIAEHHGGRIWAESAGEGQGSRFCVSLPLPLSREGG